MNINLENALEFELSNIHIYEKHIDKIPFLEGANSENLKSKLELFIRSNYKNTGIYLIMAQSLFNIRQINNR